MLPSLWMETEDGVLKTKIQETSGHRAGLNTVEKIIEETIKFKY